MMPTVVEPMQNVPNVGGTVVFVQCECDDLEDVTKDESAEDSNGVGGMGRDVGIQVTRFLVEFCDELSCSLVKADG